MILALPVVQMLVNSLQLGFESEVKASVTVAASARMIFLGKYSNSATAWPPLPDVQQKFPLESIRSIFFSSNVGFVPPVNLNLHMLTWNNTMTLA